MSLIKELSPNQIQTARRVSTEFERFWRIFTNIKDASPKDVRWAEEFKKTSFDSLKQMAQIENDPQWQEVHELIFLGLFHHNYSLPAEYKFSDPRRN